MVVAITVVTPDAGRWRNRNLTFQTAAELYWLAGRLKSYVAPPSDRIHLYNVYRQNSAKTVDLNARSARDHVIATRQPVNKTEGWCSCVDRINFKQQEILWILTHVLRLLWLRDMACSDWSRCWRYTRLLAFRIRLQVNE